MARPVKAKKIIFWICMPLVLLLAALAVLLFAGGNDASRYDDVDALLATYNPGNFRGLTVEEDGIVTIRLEKNDIYYLLRENGMLEKIQTAVRSEKNLRRAEIGFRIADGNVILFLSGNKTLAIPVSYRLNLTVETEGTVLRFRADKILEGNRTLPESKWPEVFREDISYDLEKGQSNGLIEAYLDGNALYLRTVGLQKIPEGTLRPDEELLEKIRLLGPDRDECRELWDLLLGLHGEPVPMQKAVKLVLKEENVGDALALLECCCTDESHDELWTEAGTITRLFVEAPLQGMVEQRREELEAYAADEFSHYEKLLSSVREMYKAGALKLDQNGFLLSDGARIDPSSLTSLNVSAIDSRIVYLTSSSLKNVNLKDLPAIADLQRSGNWVPACFENRRTYDLGIILTTRTGVPLLLHMNSRGEFCPDEISMEKYIEALVNRLPNVWDADEVILGK